MQQIMLETQNKNFEINNNLLKIHSSDDYSLFYAKLISVEEIFFEESIIINDIFEKNSIKAHYKLKFENKNGNINYYMSDIKPKINNIYYYCALKNNNIINIFSDRMKFSESINKYISTTKYSSKFLTRKNSILQKLKDITNQNILGFFIFYAPFSAALSTLLLKIWLVFPLILGYLFFIIIINNITDRSLDSCQKKINDIISDLEYQ